MGTITAIEPQKKRGNRRSIYVDGEFTAGVHEDVVAALGLAVGQKLDKPGLIELLKAETSRQARESALRLLSYRDRSVAEIRKRLLGSDFPEDIVEKVIEDLSRSELLDDQKFSKQWVKSRTTTRPMGKMRLAWELRSKGVASSTIDDALEDLDDNREYEMAHSLAAARMQKADSDDTSVRRKISSLLQRRGFGWGVISKVMDDLYAEDTNDD